MADRTSEEIFTKIIRLLTRYHNDEEGKEIATRLLKMSENYDFDTKWLYNNSNMKKLGIEYKDAMD